MRAFFTRKVTLRFSRALEAIFFFSAAVAVLMLALQPVSGDIVLGLSYRSYFVMPLLNFLPVFSVCLLLFFATGSLAASCGIVGYLGLLMAVVNRIKLLLRGDPLLHWDLTMVMEALGTAEGIEQSLLPMFAACTLAYLLLSLLLSRKVRAERKPLKFRAACAFGLSLLMLLINGTLYASSAVNAWLRVSGSYYNLADIHNSKGNLYSFLYNYNVHKTRKPAGYNPAALQAAIRDYAPDSERPLSEADRPNIIMIMGESFSALSDAEAFDFTGYSDPLSTFHALSADGLSGQIVVPSRGGGTADTEFDALTGRPSRYFRTAPYAYRLVRTRTEALPSLLKSVGYATVAMHPGYRWFYNRQNAYPALGFDTLIFEDTFPPDAYLDEYISEVATFDKLLDGLQQHLSGAPETPLFYFCVTIQNHAAYLNRYLPSGTVNFTARTPFTAQEKNILSNYFQGVVDADTQLKRLSDYLETLDEPFVLVYFGDHLPALDMELYGKILPDVDLAEGSQARETLLYKTPFLIWQNKKARETTRIDARALEARMPADHVISSNYLGAYLLELLGLDTLSPFFTYENEMRGKFPVLLEGLAFAPDGSLVEAAEPDDRKALSLFQDWIYYKTANP